MQAHPIDAVIDVDPPGATGASYLRSAILSVRKGGRVALVGGRGDDEIPVSYITLLFRDITIRGSLVYEREHIRGLIKLAETGILKLGQKSGLEIIGPFPIEDFENALEAARNCAAGRLVVVNP